MQPIGCIGSARHPGLVPSEQIPGCTIGFSFQGGVSHDPPEVLRALFNRVEESVLVSSFNKSSKKKHREYQSKLGRGPWFNETEVHESESARCRRRTVQWSRLRSLGGSGTRPAINVAFVAAQQHLHQRRCLCSKAASTAWSHQTQASWLSLLSMLC